MDNTSPYYGLMCSNFSCRVGNQQFDQLCITYHGSLTNPYALPISVPGVLKEFIHGDWHQLHIHGELILPYEPLAMAVFRCFGELLWRSFFVDFVQHALLPYYHGGIDPFSILPSFVSTLEQLGFTIGELEIAFDFVHGKGFEIKHPECFINPFEGTYYSKDYRCNTRLSSENGKSRSRSDKLDSLVCIYNRARKLKLDVSYYRIEFRLKQHRKRLLIMEDLLMNLEQLVLYKGYRIKNIVSDLIPDGSIIFDLDYLEKYLPLLLHLINCDDENERQSGHY